MSTKKVKNPLTIAEASQIVGDICLFSRWRVMSYTSETIISAMALFEKTKKHFGDTLIVATMLEANISHIYTENISDFKSFTEIKVINPFE